MPWREPHARDPDSDAVDAPESGTLPQWQPPAGATLGMHSGEQPRQVEGQLGTARTLAADPSADDPSAVAPAQPVVPPPLPSQPPLAPGDLIGGRYVIEEAISSGGFGAVYRASDRQIRNHQVALKLLHTPAASEQANEQALRELTLIASVSHPSVVQFKDYGWHEGRLWFTMPWYEGMTLDRLIDPSAPMTRAEAQPIFERIARGLAAMHEVGIHHHDIKPENIFLADIAGFDGGLPVLLDLGIAAPRGEGPGGLTVEYAAPETAAAALGAEHEPIGAAADVFSLALVLRNVLAPESAPSTQGELMALLHRRASEPIAAPDTRDLRYLKSHFERWLNPDPQQRPSATELADELAVLTAPEERRLARQRLLRRLLPVVAAALLAVGALGAELYRQRHELSAKQQRLDAEIRESDELRLQSNQQLMQLEEQMAAIGSKDRELSRAVALARQLHDELEREETRRRTLGRRLKRTEDERENLQTERDDLRTQRDSLRETRDRLEQERDTLVKTRDRLSQERDLLESERDHFRERHARLGDELANVQQRLTAIETASKVARERERELEKRVRELDSENTKLLAARNRLELELKRAQAERRATRLRRSRTTPQGTEGADPNPAAPPGNSP